jgi:hypothetical protein
MRSFGSVVWMTLPIDEVRIPRISLISAQMSTFLKNFG